jgi:hypothetical protein
MKNITAPHSARTVTIMTGPNSPGIGQFPFHHHIMEAPPFSKVSFKRRVGGNLDMGQLPTGETIRPGGTVIGIDRLGFFLSARTTHFDAKSSFPPKRSPDAGDGCATNHFQPLLLLVAELDQNCGHWGWRPWHLQRADIVAKVFLHC